MFLCNEIKILYSIYYIMAFMEMLIIPLCFEPICKVSSSAQGIYSLMSNISSFTKYPSVINILKKLDIEASVRILENLVKELHIKNKTKTLEKSLELLKKCLIDIENELSVIHQKLIEDSQIWFKSFRGHNFIIHINKLESLNEQLEKRSNMFFNILKTNNELVMYINPCGENDMSIIGL
jgi:hypothetical protein